MMLFRARRSNSSTVLLPRFGFSVPLARFLPRRRFCGEHRKAVSAAHPEWTQPQVLQELARMWNAHKQRLQAGVGGGSAAAAAAAAAVGSATRAGGGGGGGGTFAHTPQPTLRDIFAAAAEEDDDEVKPATGRKTNGSIPAPHVAAPVVIELDGV
jgi:hypothetical protein